MTPRIPALRRVSAALLLSAAVTALPACGGHDDSAGHDGTTGTVHMTVSNAEGPTVVASTGWVAAIAKLAGAGDITIIAPSSVQHPPDYEPKPSDLAAVSGADIVLLAGFEGFAKQLGEAAGGKHTVEVATTYDPAKLEAEIIKLGKHMGTEDVARENAASVRTRLEAVCADLRAEVPSPAPVVVAHMFVTEWAACAGLTPAGTYGPAPITPGEVKQLSGLGPRLVLENRHMAGSGEAVAAASGAKMVELVNFPDDGNLDLIAVAEQDAALIADAMRG
ncbi:MAG: zinc ABC transporter substrate-binding protein [Thermoleophilia bacterium]